MASKPKEIAPPFSTGGGGVIFETRVQASFAILMLADGFSPCLPNWPISKIQLQGKHLGYETDDLIVFAENTEKSLSAKLLGQVKHSIAIVESSTKCGEVIEAAWADFNNPTVFSQSADKLALITGPLAARDLEVREVLEWARTSGTHTDFFSKINLGKFSSNVKRQRIKAIRHHLDAANGSKHVSDADTWEFLRCFHLLVYDLDIEFGVNQAFLHSLINQYDVDAVSSIWSDLVLKVQTINQTAGEISEDTLPQHIVEAFSRVRIETIPVEFVSPVSSSLLTRWATTSHADLLAILVLLGSWDESNESDKNIVEKLASEPYDDFIKKVRAVLTQPDAPIQHKQLVWTVKDRKGLLLEVYEQIFDSHLDLLKLCAIEVLSQIDPRFDFPGEDRFGAVMQGKERKYSRQLTEGLADGLALIGNSGGLLSKCSVGKAREVAVLGIRDILDDN